MLPEKYIKYKKKDVCLTEKDYFIGLCKHSEMVNTKFKLQGCLQCLQINAQLTTGLNVDCAKYHKRNICLVTRVG